MALLNPPRLATFELNPSWTNRHRRIDRSACLELRASDIWPLVTLNPTRNYTGLEATATTHITALQLESIHDRRPPRPLIGDYRTGKSNPVKPPDPINKNEKTSNQTNPAPIPTPGPDQHLPPNPNRGATRTKILGLPADPREWHQKIRIERWRLHPRLAQHFLICPRCDQRFLKLFLPLCTPQELRDAQIAQTWIKSHKKQSPNAPLSETTTRLITRYETLFHPRTLKCRHCLTLRYGEVKRKK